MRPWICYSGQSGFIMGVNLVPTHYAYILQVCLWLAGICEAVLGLVTSLALASSYTAKSQKTCIRETFLWHGFLCLSTWRQFDIFKLYESDFEIAPPEIRTPMLWVKLLYSKVCNRFLNYEECSFFRLISVTNVKRNGLIPSRWRC